MLRPMTQAVVQPAWPRSGTARASRTRPWFVGVALTIALLVAPALTHAHGWPEIGRWSPHPSEVDQALRAAEQLQVAALAAVAAGDRPAPAAHDPGAGATLWWAWLLELLDVGDRDAQAAIREAVVAAGFDHDPAQAVAWWTAAMELLVAGTDLLRAQPVDRAALEAVVTGDADGADEAEAVHAARLLHALDTFDDASTLETVRPRVESLMAAAETAR